MRLDKPIHISQITIPRLPRNPIRSAIQGPVADRAAGFIIELRDQFLRKLARFLLRIAHNHMHTQPIIQSATIGGRPCMYRLHPLAQIFLGLRPHEIDITMFGAKLDRIGRIAAKIKQRATVLLIGTGRLRTNPLEVINLS